MDIDVQEYNIDQPRTIVFIHGGGVSGWIWDKQVKGCEGFHCLVPDLPGHGSSRAIQHFSIPECAQMIAELIRRKAHQGKAHVVGHSIGGQILLQLLADSPEVLRSAVVNSALVRPLGTLARWIKPSVKLTIPLTRVEWFAKLQAGALSIPKEYFPKYYHESKSITPEILEQVLMENALFKLPEVLANHNVPTLVLVGQKERSVMLKSARDLVTMIPHATGYRVQGVGHGFNVEEPLLYNEILQAWFMQIPLPRERLIKVSQWPVTKD